MKIHTFLKKAEMLETVCLFGIENVVLGIKKVMKHLSKIFVKSMQEKGMQKIWKLMQTCFQNGSQNLKNTGTNGIRKLMLKFYAKKKSKRFANPDFN